ncbi:hypothetical protein [Alicyclobacillus mengziensis]|nr:hypothetical protein [Alicyclobacillus mengziensis]
MNLQGELMNLQTGVDELAYPLWMCKGAPARRDERRLGIADM